MTTTIDTNEGTTEARLDEVQAQFELDEMVAAWRDLKERRLKIQRELGALKAEEDAIAARLLEIASAGPVTTAHGVLGINYREVSYREKAAYTACYPQLVLVK